MNDHAVFVLEKLKYSALVELESRVEKHLKDKFYSQILPTILKQITNQLVVDLVNDDDQLQLTIKINTEG